MNVFTGTSAAQRYPKKPNTFLEPTPQKGILCFLINVWYTTTGITNFIQAFCGYWYSPWPWEMGNFYRNNFPEKGTFSCEGIFLPVEKNFLLQLKTVWKKSGWLENLSFACEFNKCSHHDLHIFGLEVVMKCYALLMWPSPQRRCENPQEVHEKTVAIFSQSMAILTFVAKPNQ